MTSVKQTKEHTPPPPDQPRSDKRLRRIVSCLAFLAFAAFYALELRDSLREGRNLDRVSIRLKADNEPPPESTRVTVRTPWSESDLERSDDTWTFKTGQTRAVPELLLQSQRPPESIQAQITFGDVAHVKESQTTNWQDLELAAPDENGLSRFQTNHLGHSLILSALNRTAINWRGDVRFLVEAMVAPLTRVVPFWLAIISAIWVRSGMQATSQNGMPTTKRPTQNQTRIEGLDHIRGVAILMVVTYHFLFATFAKSQLGWNGWFPNFDQESRTFLAMTPLTYGFGGVAVFFALSGFCIHLSYERSSDKSWGTYLWRRLFRIYPPYLVALLFFAFLFPLTMVDFSGNGARDFYSRLFLYFNLSKDTYWGINSSFWSVTVEMQLYLVYPFLLIAARRVGWTPVLAVSLLIELGLKLPSSEFRNLVPSFAAPFAMTHGPFGYLFSWLIGAKLADDYIAGRTLTLRRVPMAVWLTLLLVTLLFKPAAPLQFLMFSLTTIGAMGRYADGSGFNFKLPQSVTDHIAWVGTISYSVYLLHQPFLNLAPKILTWLNGGQFVHPALKLLSCVAAYPFILWISRCMFHRVELPAIAAGKWFVNQRASKSTAAQAGS